MNLTIARVFESVRPWESKQGGPMVTILVEFADGRRGQINAKADNKDKRIAEMKALIGQAGEFEVDEGDGKFPMKVKSWPGKAAFGSGPGGEGSKWQPKSIEERNEIIAQSCLNAAVALVNGLHIEFDSITSNIVRTWQEEFFHATVRLARGSEVGAPSGGSRGGDGPSGMAASGEGLPRPSSRPENSRSSKPETPVAPASEHQSAPGGDPYLGKGGQSSPGADATSVVPSAPGSVGGAPERDLPGTEVGGAADTGQAATDGDREVWSPAAGQFVLVKDTPGETIVDTENPEWERLNRKAHAIARGLARDDESSHDALKRIWKPYLGGRSLTAVTAEELRSWMPDLEVLARSGG